MNQDKATFLTSIDAEIDYELLVGDVMSSIVTELGLIAVIGTGSILVSEFLRRYSDGLLDELIEDGFLARDIWRCWVAAACEGGTNRRWIR